MALLVVVIVAVAGLFAYAAGTFSTVNLNVSTATQTQPQFGYWAGSGWCGGGQNPVVDGESTGPLQGWTSTGEVFDSSKYYISWNSVGGVSETIEVAATIFACHQSDALPVFTPGTITAQRYVFEINNGGGWEPFWNNGPGAPAQGFLQTTPNFPVQYLAGATLDRFDAITFKIGGNQYQTSADGPMKYIYDGAALRVSVEIQDRGHTGDDNWYMLAQDITILRSGLVNGYWGKTLYHVNETATFTWQVPTVLIADQTAYYLTITNDNTGTALAGYSYMPITSTFGQATVPITPSMFVEGGVNQLRAIISTPILNAKSVPVSMRFSSSDGPVITAVTFNKAYYNQGDSVVVTWNATPDPATGKPILYYRVEADIEGFQALSPQIVYGTRVSFTAAATGPLDVFITAYDAYGPGAVYDARSTVGNPVDICKVYPTAPVCTGGGPPGGVPIWLILVLIAIVAGAVALLVPSDLFGKVRIRPFTRLIVLIVAVMLGIVAWLVYPG